MFVYAGLAALVAGSALVRAEVVPTAPGPGDVFQDGGKCTFTWTADTTGTWKTMNVEIMSGSNLVMNHITSASRPSMLRLQHELICVASSCCYP